MANKTRNKTRRSILERKSALNFFQFLIGPSLNGVDEV